MNETRYRDAERRFWNSVDVVPTERMLHLKRNDVTIRVLEVGEGPPVVFVHGATNGATSWASLAARLPGFRCILVDRPGCGLSEGFAKPLDTEGLPRFADSVVIDVLDALEIESAHLVGTSFGGYIALRTAAAHPDRIRRMMQFSWPAGVTARMPAFMRIASVPGVSRLMSLAPANERSVRMIFRSIGHGPSLKAGRITPADLDWYLALLRHTDTMRNELALIRRLMSPRRGLREEIVLSNSTLASITTPTFFLWGAHDPFGDEAFARNLIARMPNAELEVMPTTGHAPWLDDADHCARATSSFLGT